MAQDSKRKRHTRRLKRQASQAARLVDFVLKQRDAYRAVGEQLALELEKKIEKDQNLIVEPTLGQIARASGLDTSKGD